MAGEEACLGLGEPRGGTSSRIFASMLWKSLLDGPTKKGGKCILSQMGRAWG